MERLIMEKIAEYFINSDSVNIKQEKFFRLFFTWFEVKVL